MTEETSFAASATEVLEPEVLEPEAIDTEIADPLDTDDIVSRALGLKRPAPNALDDTTAQRLIEAILMISEDPVPLKVLAQAIGRTPDETEQLADEIATALKEENRGFILARIAGGYRFQTNPELAPHIEQFLLSGQSARLSAAALETLAVVAYRQPISRAQISAIRGVNVDGVMRTLEQRGLVAEVSRDPGPGRAALYATTPAFLERLGIDSLEELAPLGQFAPDRETVEALEASLFAAAS